MAKTLVADPKTRPPDPDKAYVCVAGPDGEEEWILLHSDAADGITGADFDFAATRRKHRAG